uniref:RxLR effector protein n=2 Tax=Hyaloperonospora arabidopsidis (strain Emoy2) TaxID=559515 RepID=M4BUJ9_HYAAE
MVKYFRLFGLALVLFAHCGALSSPAVRKPPQSTSPDLYQSAQLETDDKRMRQRTDVTNLAVSEERAAFDVGPPTEKGITRLIYKLRNWRWVKDPWEKLKNSKLMRTLRRWIIKKWRLIMGVPAGKKSTFDEKVVTAQVFAHKVASHEDMYKQGGVRLEHVAEGLGLTKDDFKATGVEKLEKIDKWLVYETYKKNIEELEKAKKV